MQFYEGQLDFTDKFTSGMLNSVQDELSAYRRQLAIGADSIGILSNDLNIITLEFITLLDPTYGTLPNTVLTINDTINHIEQAHIASGSIFTPQFQIFRNNGIDFAKKYCEVLEFIREVYFFDKLNQKVKNR